MEKKNPSEQMVKGEKMEIRQLTLQDFDKYREISYRSYPSIRDFSPQGYQDYDQSVQALMESQNEELFFGAIEDGKVVGIMRHILFQMNIFGKMEEVGGFGYLGVDPFYKRRGLAGQLLAYFEKTALERGNHTALLLPFRPDFYHKFGYGFLGKMNQYQVQTSYLPQKPDQVTVREIKAQEALTFRKNATGVLHGMTQVLAVEEEAFQDDLKNIYIGAFLDKKLIAYGKYHWKSLNEENYTQNAIVLSDLLSIHPLGIQGVLSHLRAQSDQARYVDFFSHQKNLEQIMTNPTDQSHHYFANGYIQTNIQAIGLMAKILNPCAFYQTHYQDQAAIEIRTEDKVYRTSPNPKYSFYLPQACLAPLVFKEISFRQFLDLGLAQAAPDDLKALEEIFPGGYTVYNNADF